MARRAGALRKATLQSCILSATSTIIAQLLRAYRSSSKPLSTGYNPLGLQWAPILQFLFIALLTTPPNFLWQQFLEARFPGYPASKDKQKLKVDDDGKGVTVEQKLDVKNTAIKFALDQSIGAWLNTAAFVGGITLIRGGSIEDCITSLKLDFWPIQSAGYKLWPAVSLLNFLVIPAERRVVFASAVGLFWNIYMVLRVSS
ncbi:MAG: hypothetical protein MMC23_004352 [Stictis urceolatum]|nr:hypothetical protein [Stictis urceolata]